MVRTDETALICDLAETYGVLNWRALPLSIVAALAVGLRDDSRIKMSISGRAVSGEMMLLAAAVDRLSLLVWSKTKDAEKGRNKPDSIAQRLCGDVGKEKQSEYRVYRTAEEFEAARKRALGGE